MSNTATKKKQQIPKPIIGLEIHVELKTTSKMFCQCSANYFGKKPNTQTCPVCLGLPGALPVPNKTAIDWVIRIARALNCRINTRTKFDRKHYFYPDLPKGYQISQYDQPFGENGHMDLVMDDGSLKTFRFRRVHLEEDTAKNIHEGEDTLVDFNRSGVPLVEIVTEADFDNSDDVKRFLEELQTIIRYLEVADADMEKGDMRLEPNISILMMSPGEVWDGTTFPDYKVEVKNINSFRFAKMAIDYELKRQQALLEKGETPKQETRGFNEKKSSTVSQRTKENAGDYRYFPEPDIPLIEFTDDQVTEIESHIPELPGTRLLRFHNEYGIKISDAFLLTRSRSLAEFYEVVVKQLTSELSDKNEAEIAQKVANMIVNKKIDTNLHEKQFVKKAKEQLEGKKTDMGALDTAVNSVIHDNPQAVDDYQNGKEQALMFLLGQVMKKMRGQAEAPVVKQALKERLQ